MEISANILRILNNNLKIPAFILDQHGELLALNESARKLYTPDLPLNSYWALFSPESTPVIKKTFNEAAISNKSLVESTNIILQNNQKKRVEITFSGLGENGNKLILSTFDFDFTNSQKLKLTVKTEELKEIIRSEIFISILEEIRSSFPFTLLGKAKIRNEINKLHEYFWLKDIEGKYLLVNNKFAKNLGLKTSQLEGKFEKEFLPKYLSGFFDAVDEFIQNTTSVIIREGVTHPISSENRSLRIIEFPLCDLDNRAIAIIGIAEELNNTDESLCSAEPLDLKSFVNVLNCPSAILNPIGDVQVANNSYSDLINQITNVEKTEFEFEIKSLCSALSNSSEISISSNKSFKNTYINYIFTLGRINNTNEHSNLLLQVTKKSEDTDTEILLNNRGKMYEILMQTSPEPMYIYDIENLRFLEVNKAALDIYGYSRNEFLQMDLTDLYAPEDIQTLLDSGNSRSKEGVFTGPWRHKKRDGSSILVEISKVSFDYKKSKSHFNIIRDVTNKIEIDKELQMYKSIFENCSDMIFITDAEGFITYSNDLALSALGFIKDELQMRPIITLVSDHLRSDISHVFYSMGEKTSLTDIEFKKKDGTILNLDLFFNPVFDYNEQIVSYNVIAKRNEKPVNITQTESPAKQQSAAAIDTALLSSMFHEILTPINVILGFVQEITDNIQNPNDEMKEASEIINQNRQVLLQTMDSVLEYSHIIQKRIEVKPEKIFFTDILDNLQKNTKKTADNNKIEFSYGKISSSLNIETDVHRMESLLSMFVTAAMRITKEKTIYISAYQYDDQNYIISIKDSRRSVSEYLAESLNQIFSNDKEILKDYGISKLSIHLARKLNKILNGRFELIRKSDEVIECGFIFPFILKTEKVEDTITNIKPIATDSVKQKELIQPHTEKEILEEQLPATPQQTIPEEIPIVIEEIPEPEKPILQENPIISESSSIVDKPIPVPEAATPTGTLKQVLKIELPVLKCLYVEDQIDSQILFKVQMKELKHMDFAVSFEAALPLLQQNKYDFIIMDINLQGEYNGLDALRIIRRLPGYERTQIIAVTAYVLPGDKEKFIAAGFNDFISKPILREKLIDSLNKILI